MKGRAAESVFQRAGGWCEPVRNADDSLSPEQAGKTLRQVIPPGCPVIG